MLRWRERISWTAHVLMVIPLKWPFTTSVKPLLQYFSNFTVQRNHLGNLVQSVASQAPPAKILIHYSWGGSKSCLVKPVPWDWVTKPLEKHWLLDHKPPAGKPHPPQTTNMRLPYRRRWLLQDCGIKTVLFPGMFAWELTKESPQKGQIRRSRLPKILHFDRDWLGSTQFHKFSFLNYQLQKIILVSLIKISFRMIDS